MRLDISGLVSMFHMSLLIVTSSTLWSQTATAKLGFAFANKLDVQSPSFTKTLSTDEQAQNDPDYLIIGAGGSGIQTALFLQKYEMSYKILEKEQTVGSFWQKFPVFGEVISVNKCTRESKERMRYDLHSMLEAPIAMRNITKDYFPQGNDWHLYMKTVVEMANIDIEYGTEVAQVFQSTSNLPCVQLVDGTQRCARKRIFVGTGLKEKPEPLLRAMGGIPYSEMTKEKAEGKRVCILGNGNSGFEVAQNVFDVADRVTLYGKHPHRLSSITRYTGDVRVKYLQILENPNAKLLDTVDSFADLSPPSTSGLEQVLNSTQLDTVNQAIGTASWLEQFDCETFVITTGFKSNVPGALLPPGKTFPSTKDYYESTDIPNVHYIGWLMHERDFKRGAGGFFSGYRYLIRNLINHIREVDQEIEYPYKVLSKTDVIDHVVERFKYADDLIILQDGVTVRDIIVPVKTGDDDEILEYHYYEGVTYAFHPELTEAEGAISIYFTWGDGRTRTAQHVFDGIYRFSDTKRLINLFLHPIIQVGNVVREIHEDLEMAWKSEAYMTSVKAVIQKAVEADLSDFRTRSTEPYHRATFNQSDYEAEWGYYEVADLKPNIDPDVIQAIWKTVYTNYDERYVGRLEDATKQWLPKLFET